MTIITLEDLDLYHTTTFSQATNVSNFVIRWNIGRMSYSLLVPERGRAGTPRHPRQRSRPPNAEGTFDCVFVCARVCVCVCRCMCVRV
jgi:hypothetical protein